MTEFATSTAPTRGGVRFKHIALLLLFAFVGGAGASWWLADRYGWFDADQPAVAPAPTLPASPQSIAPLVVAPAPTSGDGALAAGNAARAEGLMVAFAARRAIDSGAPLGYLTDQLRLRFGASQPQAVLTVMQASQSPVSLQALQAELTAIEHLLLTGSRDETVWANIKREMSELFVLRKADSPSPAPTQRMLRAHALVESGNLAGAVAEVSAMPGASDNAAQNWLARARKYDDVRKALDRLERSALAAPVMPAPPLMAEPAPVDELPETIVPK
jgi:Mitochondrial inner membrane protein